MKPSVIIVVLCMAGLAACKGSNSGGSPTAPGGSGTGTVTGTWTGTLTRPAGRGSLSVQWQVTVDGYTLKGPMTITNGGASVTIPAQGVTAGNDNNGYGIHMSINSNSGDIPAFPTCAVRGNTAGSGGGDPFPKPYTTITTPTFDMNYSGCLAFINNGSQNGSFAETVRLELRK